MGSFNSPLVLPLSLSLSFLLGGLAGRLAVVVGESCLPGSSGRPALRGGWPLLSSFRSRSNGLSRVSVVLLEWGTAVLFTAFAAAYLLWECQKTHEVAPDPFWLYARLPYHLALIGLLVIATATDLVDYVIPDQVTWLGTSFGLLAAIVSGDLQMIHVWVDWNAEIPGLQGPYLPRWLAEHHHLHGLAWSGCGILAGAGAVQTVRGVAGLVLGREAMGLGDVFLMGMIGSFIGWQPVLCALVLAPLCGLVIAPVVWLTTGRTFVPFGPYLALGAIVVLFSWRWIWFWTRNLFGHWPTLVGLGGGTLAAFVALLFLVALFRTMPVRKTPPDAGGSSER